MTGTGPTPTGELAGDLAYDARDQEYVYFGGCAKACPTNVTWTFAHGTWTNVTSWSEGPSARYYAMMDFDPNAGGILLFGGVNAAGTNLDDTWLFQNGTWTSLPGPAPSYRGAGVLAFDASPSVNATVLFGGCHIADTLACTNDTWTWRPGAGWQILSSSSGPSPRAYAFGAYDPILGDIVVFGGLGPCPGIDCDFHDTWLFNGTAWTQVRISGGAPEGRYSGGFAFVPAEGTMLLYGGYNLSMDSTEDDSWSFDGGSWTSLGTSPGPGYRGDPSMATGGYGEPPLLYGGGEDDAPSNPTTTWTFEAQPTVELAAPGPLVDAGTTVLLNGTVRGGTPPFEVSVEWANGNGLYEINGTYFQLTAEFPVGPVTLASTVVDAFGISGVGSTNLTSEAPPAVEVETAPGPFEAGQKVPFLGQVLQSGTGGLTEIWQFGDGSTAAGLEANHTYAAAGTFAVNFSATDSEGFVAVADTEVTILASPNVTITIVGVPALDQPLGFDAGVIGGVGPLTFTWWFGDGAGSGTQNTSHSYDLPGTYLVRCWANDTHGGVAFDSVRVDVPAAPSGPTPLPNSPGASPKWTLELAVAGIVGGALVIAVLGWRRIRQPRRFQRDALRRL